MKKMLRLITVLIILTQLVSCSCINTTCPEFPSPNDNVKATLRVAGEQDVEFKAWLNDLLRLKKKLE